MAAPGFMSPEGVVIFHAAAGYLFKKTILNDDTPSRLIAKPTRTDYNIAWLSFKKNVICALERQFVKKSLHLVIRGALWGINGVTSPDESPVTILSTKHTKE